MSGTVTTRWDWGEAKRLETGGGPEDGNGLDVAVEGDIAVIGYPASSGICCAYMHQRDSGGVENWGRVKTLMAGDPGVRTFGGAVSLSGDWIAVSAADADDRIVVYLYRRNFGGQGNWGLFQKLVLDDDGGEEDVFEAHELLALDGNTLVVGSYDATVNAAGEIHQGQGVAYLFEREIPGSGYWVRTKKLVASDGHANQWFGFSAAVSDNKVIVGAVWADVEGAEKQGAAYVFQQDAGGAGNWGEVEKLHSASGADREYFGASVASSFETDLLGATGASFNGGESQGKVFYTIRFVASHRLWLPLVQNR